jgi:hypothetical protein
MAQPKPLEPGLREKLGNYVYALCDPRDGNKIFYIGRGKDDRVLQHEWDAAKDGNTTAKLDLIREIQATGVEVEKVILRYGMTQTQAIVVEATLIDALLYFGASLKNLVRGAEVASGLRRLNDLRVEHAARPLEVDRDTVIVSINQTWNAKADDAALWEMSRRWWQSRPDQPSGRPFFRSSLLLSVADNLVRGAWALDPNQLGRQEKPTWEQIGERRQRIFYFDNPACFEKNPLKGWCFDGTPLPAGAAARYIGQSFKFQPNGTVRYLSQGEQWNASR